LQADAVDAPESPVWLNRLSIEDAVKAGASKYMDIYGSSIPKNDK